MKLSWSLIKLIVTVVIISGLIYCLVYISDTYADGFNNFDNFNDFAQSQEVEPAIDNQLPPIFQEQMEYFSAENQKRLAEANDKLKAAQSSTATAESYKNLLENGLLPEQNMAQVQPQSQLRELRDIGPEAKPYTGLPRIEQPKQPVGTPLIAID
jgi:hypothetical protein